MRFARITFRAAELVATLEFHDARIRLRRTGLLELPDISRGGSQFRIVIRTHSRSSDTAPSRRGNYLPKDALNTCRLDSP